MDEDFVNNIFKKFNQEDSSISRKYGGTGLGMAITKELIFLMDGKIEVTSKKNVGTTTTITLTLNKGNKELQEKATQEQQNISIEGLNILLVEDNELNQLVAEHTLKHFKCNITKAENGRIALQILSKKSFDIILMDIQMPELDGIEATKILRQELGIKTPIIALTANAFKTEIENCINVGMNDYITKPFVEENLVSIIYKHTKMKKKSSSDTFAMEETLYDLKSIQTLSRGDEIFIKKMLTIFIIQTEQAIPLIEKAFNEKNYIEIAKLIHKIKPSVEGVGIHSIKEEMKLLETKAKEQNGEIDELYALFEKIKHTLNMIIIQLKQEFT
ncbi:Autoinducer 2 sensor kinase/phosphatase LuxQ [Chryseobacterium fistulae]|uniref:histidine kinase n=2 Tax=Chryseobacterium fistulae TaxID=2675058 RepID=A0A6N4XT79_9FLAO|nr:Autoinducer 2 sensor kinase/phosphatase LuxQ [Chryseobacterium fistulae]